MNHYGCEVVIQQKQNAFLTKIQKMPLWKASSTIMFRANLRSLKAATANFINPRKHTVAQLPYTQRHMPMKQEEA